jgi:hypothetical protein
VVDEDMLGSVLDQCWISAGSATGGLSGEPLQRGQGGQQGALVVARQRVQLPGQNERALGTAVADERLSVSGDGRQRGPAVAVVAQPGQVRSSAVARSSNWPWYGQCKFC